ncbi:MAG: hypothetical protein IID18_09090 [Nitrospinae bacterium]|nr:hypothetical protein [Nitrospinota bacterium]
MKREIRIWIGLSIIAVFSLSGCATGKVLTTQYAHESTSCTVLDEKLDRDLQRIRELEETEHTWQNVRDVLLGAGGIAFPPLGILNAFLFFTDSHMADLSEAGALRDRYNTGVLFSHDLGCGFKYALIPVEAPEPLENDPNV